MAVYSFRLTDRVRASCVHSGAGKLPREVRVMHAGECVCNARLEDDAYTCELPHEYIKKLTAAKLDQVFVFEPPLTEKDLDENVARELVSILLVASPR